MSLMTGRYESLQRIVAAADKVAVPFVGYDGNAFISCGISDDVGIYYFIPQLVSSFGVSLDQAINLFFYGLLFIGFFLGLLGFFLLYKSLLARSLSLVALTTLFLVSTRLIDVYVAYVVGVVAIMPLFLYFLKREKVDTLFLVGQFFFGCIIGFLHFVRAFSSGASLLFILVITLCARAWHWKEKLLLLGVLCAGLLVPKLYFDNLFHQHEQFAQKSISTYYSAPKRHVFWHSVYVGLGFLTNDKGIRWDDSVAIEKARAIDPEAIYPSQRYEQVIKNEVITVFKKDPRFVVHTFFAKIGLLLYYLLLAANFGLVAAYLRPKPWFVELGFWTAVAFNALFGLLTVPCRPYVLGFIACCVVYAVVSINYVIDE